MEWFATLPWIFQALLVVFGVLVCLALLGPALGSLIAVTMLVIGCVTAALAAIATLIILPASWLDDKTGFKRWRIKRRQAKVQAQREKLRDGYSLRR